MRVLTNLAVVLCVFAQVWVGCAGGNKTLCVCDGHGGEFAVGLGQDPFRPQGSCGEQDGCGGTEAGHAASHHGSGWFSIPSPVPVHGHDREHHDGCCLDIPIEDAGRIPHAGNPRLTDSWRLAVPIENGAGFSGAAVGAHAVLRAGRAGAWSRIGWGGAAALSARASCGIATTRLLI